VVCAAKGFGAAGKAKKVSQQGCSAWSLPVTPAAAEGQQQQAVVTLWLPCSCRQQLHQVELWVIQTLALSIRLCLLHVRVPCHHKLRCMVIYNLKFYFGCVRQGAEVQQHACRHAVAPVHVCNTHTPCGLPSTISLTHRCLVYICRMLAAKRAGGVLEYSPPCSHGPRCLQD
jgi:hypothetical protein